MLRTLLAFPMLSIDPALPMLRIEPALPMAKIDPALTMLSTLPTIRLVNKLLALNSPARLPVPTDACRQLRLERANLRIISLRHVRYALRSLAHLEPV
jgi:hypothetical protein